MANNADIGAFGFADGGERLCRQDRYARYVAFMQHHREAVWKMCARFAHSDRERTKDMVQEVYLVLWLRFDQLDDRYGEWQQRQWLKRLTRSVLVDLYRRAEPEPEALTEQMADSLPDQSADYAGDVEEMLAVLTDDERRLMQMRLDGYDGAEIADALGISPSAVYTRTNRILKKLRTKFERRTR